MSGVSISFENIVCCFLIKIEAYQQIIALKQQNPDLKVMLAVGGWNHGSAPFTQMVATEQSRAQFVENSYNFMKRYGFDGLDLGKRSRMRRAS